MLGAIIGDTVGSVYEFHNTKDYDFTLFNAESGYTDDSVMTMAVARWLLTDPERTYQKLEDTMVEFAGNCPCPIWTKPAPPGWRLKRLFTARCASAIPASAS